MPTPININNARSPRRHRPVPAARPLRVVAIGGGTGMPVVLRGLVKVGNVDVSAIVATSDDGGSSGRLRDSMRLPAVGDLRNCLAALSVMTSPLAGLMQHRFSGGALDGHALGNLLLAALYQKMGSLTQSSAVAGRMLQLKGRAFAATESLVTLCASFTDGTVSRGESRIPESRKSIEQVWLEPQCPPASPGVLEAIHAADAVVLSPGSLYTSLIPNLLVAGVVEAIRSSSAVKILICNLMTQPGETDGFSASDHLRVVERWLGPQVVDYCIVHSSKKPLRPQKTESQPVACDSQQISAMGSVPVVDELLRVDGAKIRHDATRLGKLVVSIAQAASQKMRQVNQPQDFSGDASNVPIELQTIREVAGRVGCGGALCVLSSAGTGSN